VLIALYFVVRFAFLLALWVVAGLVSFVLALLGGRLLMDSLDAAASMVHDRLERMGP
jgi:hypothetical protein